MSIIWYITQPLVRMLLWIINLSLSMISFAQVWTVQWSDTIPSWNVQFQVRIHLTQFHFKNQDEDEDNFAPTMLADVYLVKTISRDFYIFTKLLRLGVLHRGLLSDVAEDVSVSHWSSHQHIPLRPTTFATCQALGPQFQYQCLHICCGHLSHSQWYLWHLWHGHGTYSCNTKMGKIQGPLLWYSFCCYWSQYSWYGRAWHLQSQAYFLIQIWWQDLLVCTCTLVLKDWWWARHQHWDVVSWARLWCWRRPFICSNPPQYNHLCSPYDWRACVGNSDVGLMNKKLHWLLDTSKD